MENRVTSNVRSSAVAATLLCLVAVPGAPATTPQYQIYDIGVVQVGDTASQGFGVSRGGTAVGRSVRTGGSQAFTWTLNGGIVGLPNLAGRSYAVSNSANDNGIVVGTAATTLFGSNRLPVIWQNGVGTDLNTLIPAGSGITLTSADGIDDSGQIVANGMKAGSSGG